MFAWRDKISYVTQDAATFSGTVRESMTYGVGRPVSDEELAQAAKLSGL